MMYITELGQQALSAGRFWYTMWVLIFLVLLALFVACIISADKQDDSLGFLVILTAVTTIACVYHLYWLVMCETQPKYYLIQNESGDLSHYLTRDKHEHR